MPMNRVIGFSTHRGPCRLIPPGSEGHKGDLGTFRSPINLFFNQVVVIRTWGTFSYLHGNYTGWHYTGCWIQISPLWKMFGIFWPLLFQSDLKIVLPRDARLASHPGAAPVVPGMLAVVMVTSFAARLSQHNEAK